MTALAMDMRELSWDEIEEVTGGPGPLIALVFSPPVIAAVVAGAAVVTAAVVAMVDHLSSDDCVKTTTTRNGKTVEVTSCT